MGDDDIANIPVAKGSFTMVKRADFEGEMRANLSLGAGCKEPFYMLLLTDTREGVDVRKL